MLYPAHRGSLGSVEGCRRWVVWGAYEDMVSVEGKERFRTYVGIDTEDFESPTSAESGTFNC